MKSSETELPPNWASAKLADVSAIMSGYGFPESLQGRTDGEIPFYKVGDISDAWKRGTIQLSTAKHYVTQKVADSLHAKLLPASTTVFAKIGAAIALNRRAMLSVPSLVDNNVMGLRPIQMALNPVYLFYFACTLRLNEISQATTVPSIRKSDVERIRVPLPPIREQERIVSEIEKQFTRLDAAVAALRRVQANLKRYRAAVLKAACEGRLVPTEDELARREGRAYEPASILLERILAERRTSWEAAQKSGKRGKYKDPRNLDRSILEALPQGWAWASLGSIGELKGGLTKGQKRRPTEIVRQVPYLRVANVQRGYLDLSEIKTIDATPNEVEELRLVEGDVLFNEGGDRDKLGRGWIWEGKIPLCVHQNHVFRARLKPDLIQPKFLSWYGNSVGRHYFEDEGKQTTNLASVNMTKLSMLPVPVPPAAEQKRIVVELDRRLSVIDRSEIEVTTEMKRSERLRQSILKRAFEGRLVPQDPRDEPASVLLESIRSDQNAAYKNAPRTTPGRRKKEAARVA